jgi:hypothetical protein
MNADPTDTPSPHLDLEDLVASANGQPIGDAAREHLAGCPHCLLEASRWNLVASGVRGLAAASEAPPAAASIRPGLPAMPSRAAWPTEPKRARRRVLAGRARGALLVAGSAAAALVLLVGVGVGSGLVQVNLSGPHAKTVLTAVGGCAALQSATGTLEQVNGSSLVIKTASGQPLTVTTTAATEAGEVGASGSLQGDIMDGAPVTVWGPSSGGTIAAFGVIIANPAQQHPQPPPGMVVVKGTVADAGTAGFTVVTADGTRVPVTTSGDTSVSVLNASLGQFPVGASILALGSAGPDGTLSAVGVVAILALPPAAPPVGLPGGPQLHAQVHVQTRARGQVHVKNCSPAAVDEVLAAGG